MDIIISSKAESGRRMIKMMLLMDEAKLKRIRRYQKQNKQKWKRRTCACLQNKSIEQEQRKKNVKIVVKIFAKKKSNIFKEKEKKATMENDGNS